MLHLDIKRLCGIRVVGHRITGNRQQRARGVAFDYTYVAIDDHSRVAFAQIWPAERADCAAGFLRQTLAYYRTLGLRIRRILTDNGKVFSSRDFTAVCQQHHIRCSHTRPYRVLRLHNESMNSTSPASNRSNSSGATSCTLTSRRETPGILLRKNARG